MKFLHFPDKIKIKHTLIVKQNSKLVLLFDLWSEKTSFIFRKQDERRFYISSLSKDGNTIWEIVFCRG